MARPCNLVKTTIGEANSWTADILDRKKLSFMGYNVILYENWNYPTESKDFHEYPKNSSYRLDGTTDIMALCRTLVPATAVKLFGEMLDIVASRTPSANTYSVVLYHVTYYKGGRDHNMRRFRLFNMADLKGGTKYAKPNLHYDGTTGEFKECER